MIDKRKYQLTNLIDSLKKNDEIKIFLINGIFGSGKSEFIKELMYEIKIESVTDAVIHFNVGTNKEFIVDYVLDNDIEFINDDAAYLNYDFSECTYNKTRFFTLLNNLKQKSEEQYSQIYHALSMKRLPGFSETDNFNADIIEFFDKKSDRTLLTRTERAVSESLIVDLLNLICPLNADRNSYSTYLEHLVQPYKIIFVLDNFDNHHFSILKWLNDEMIPLCQNGKLGDFICFQVGENDFNLKISQLIDIKFVISTRINPVISNDLKYLFESKIKFERTELTLFDLTETDEYLSKYADELTVDSEKIFQYSAGLQYLIDLLTKYNKDELNEITRDNGHFLLSSKILDYEDKNIVEAIKASTVIDYLDKEYLGFIKSDVFDSDHLLKQLTYSNDLFTFEENKIILIEPFRTILRKYLERNDKILVLEYQYINKIIEEKKEKFNNLNSEEFNILRSFAYFNNFDSNFALEKAFDDKADDARKFIKKHANLFKKNKQTFILKVEYINILNDYNRLIDKEKFELKKKLIDRIWNERRMALNDEKSVITGRISEAESAHKEINENPHKHKQDYDNHQRNFIETENELIKIKKSLENYSSSKHLSSFLVNVIAGVLSFFIAYFFPVIFSTPENHSSVIIIQYILFFISCVFLLISFSYLYKMLKLVLNKKEKQKIRNQIRKKQEESEFHQVQMTNLRDLTINGQKQEKEISERLTNDRSRLKELEEILNEPYI